MATPKVRAHYDQLVQIAGSFRAHAEHTRQMYQALQGHMDTLQGGDWAGQGANAFYREMRAEVFPALQRLMAALDEAAITTQTINQVMQQAEAEAAALFKAEGSRSNSATGPANQPFVQGAGDRADIDPNDVSQGALGDCYLLASLAGVALQNPEAIRRMIKDNGDGTHTVTFYQREKFFGVVDTGKFEEVEVKVKGDFPMANGQPQYAKYGDAAGGNRETWTPLVEKAYAQWKRGYSNIEGGWPRDAMEVITGKPSQTFAPGNLNVQKLADYQRQGYAIAVGSQHDKKFMDVIDIPDVTDTHPLYKNQTLVPDHAYYVTKVDPAQGTVTVRNPWGWNVQETTMPYDTFQQVFQNVDINPIN